MTENATLSQFWNRINEEFHVSIVDAAGKAGLYTLVLTEATALTAAHRPGQGREPFQLKFRGSGPGYLPQATYELRNEALGAGMVFLVPIGRESDGFTYQAIFN